MGVAAEHHLINFCRYPPVGGCDWRYAYATARVRALRAAAPTTALLADAARAGSLDAAADLLNGTPYALDQHSRTATGVAEMLQMRRDEARDLFAELVIDEPVLELFRARTDFANIRLAVRRSVLDRPIGDDYAAGGNVEQGAYAKAFEGDDYDDFPLWLRDAIDSGVLAYFEEKNMRSLDHAVSIKEAEYKLGMARRLEDIFLTNLFRVEVDLNNIGTMLRLKYLASDERDCFIAGGFVGIERFVHGVEEPYDTLLTRFLHTPYGSLVREGAHYLDHQESFLMIEYCCDEYIEGYLQQTATVSAGLQPMVAYLLLVEAEIRRIRTALTACLHDIDRRMVLDLLGHND